MPTQPACTPQSPVPLLAASSTLSSPVLAPAKSGRLERSFAGNQEAIGSKQVAKVTAKLLKDVPPDAGFRRFKPD